MRFVKLTLAHSGAPLYVNPKGVVALTEGDGARLPATRCVISLRGSDDYYCVTESVQEVASLLTMGALGGLFLAEVDVTVGDVVHICENFSAVTRPLDQIKARMKALLDSPHRPKG
jgi:hypothetical protein